MKQHRSKGDIFHVQNSDQQCTPGQVLGFETRTLHSAACAFFDQRIADLSAADSIRLDLIRCLAVLLVTPDGLDGGVWPVVGRKPVLLPSRLHPCGRLLTIRRLLRFVGLERPLLTRDLPNATIRDLCKSPQNAERGAMFCANLAGNWRSHASRSGQTSTFARGLNYVMLGFLAAILIVNYALDIHEGREDAFSRLATRTGSTILAGLLSYYVLRQGRKTT